MPKENEIQEKVILYQLLQKQLEDMKSQALLIERKLMEFEISKKALSDTKTLKDGSEILIPVGSGTYIHGSAAPSKKVLIDIGANYMISKDISSSETVLESQKSDVEKLNDKLAHEVSEVVNKINTLAMEIEQLQQK